MGYKSYMSAKYFVEQIKKYGRLVLDSEDLADNIAALCYAARKDAYLQLRFMAEPDLVEVVWVRE